jgi:hypothetical protein
MTSEVQKTLAQKTLIEELFEKGTMVMGPSRHDPAETVGTFPPDLLPKLIAERKEQVQKLQFMVGDWLTVNQVPATSQTPAYAERSKGTFRISPSGTWLCMVRNGTEIKYITYDPFSEQWMYVLAEGAYGILRSKGWQGDQIAFSGLMTMIGVERELRHTITKVNDEEFKALNEERHGDEWIYVDEWSYRRA